MGKQIDYNVVRIKEGAIEIILQGKNKIDIEGGEIHFQFVNVGNLYSRFSELKDKIH